MVMHNRNGGSDAPHWWDDLPPKVRERFTQPITHEEETRPEETPVEDPVPMPSRSELVGDLSRLAVLFVLVAVGNILFLLAALSFLNG